MSVTVWFQTSPILIHFWLPLVFHFDICKWCLICLIQQAYKDVSSSLWPHLMFCELKITNILKSSGWVLEKSELPWGQHFYSRRCVSCRTIGLPCSCLRCKLTKIALFLYLTLNVGCMTSSVISFAYFTHFSDLNISESNADTVYLQTVNRVFILSWNCM